jgi:aminopeptidase YwaD
VVELVGLFMWYSNLIIDSHYVFFNSLYKLINIFTFILNLSLTKQKLPFMKKAFIFIFILSSIGAWAQDSDMYKSVIFELSQKKYYGRGYYKDGDIKAGEYIKAQFEILGALPVGSYFQPFSFPVNVFHGKMKMSVDNKNLEPAKDFVMREYSSGIKGEYGLFYIDTTNFNFEIFKNEIEKPEHKNSFIVVDFYFFHQYGKELGSYYKSERPGFIMIWDTPLKYYKAYSSFTVPVADIWVSPDFPRNAKSVKLNVENEFIDSYEASNVVAMIAGTHKPDSFFVFTAHYDHIGMLGSKTFVPGANDNASGVAMLLSLAEHYAKPENRPECSMLFIATAGEETGLRGAYHFVENPLIPLDKIKYVINCDMVADNSDDIYVEISESGANGLECFNSINEKHSYFTELELGELAGNSDHYPFAEKNIPAIFFMMKGDAFEVYHTPLDDTDHIYLDNFPKLYKLISEFVETY